VFNPALGTWRYTGAMAAGRNYHTAALLPNGEVLVVGGWGAMSVGEITSAEQFDVALGYVVPNWQPQIYTVTLSSSSNVVVTGSQFRGIAEGSSGNVQASATDHPVVQLRSLENGQTIYLQCQSWSATSFTSPPVTNLPVGYVMVTVFVNGIPSDSILLNTKGLIAINTIPSNLIGGSITGGNVYPPGTVVNLTATPALDWDYTGWSYVDGTNTLTTNSHCAGDKFCLRSQLHTPHGDD